MPPIATFFEAARYYGVLGHELTHWTGGPRRLDRIKKYSDRSVYPPCPARRFARMPFGLSRFGRFLCSVLVDDIRLNPIFPFWSALACVPLVQPPFNHAGFAVQDARYCMRFSSLFAWHGLSSVCAENGVFSVRFLNRSRISCGLSLSMRGA